MMLDSLALAEVFEVEKLAKLDLAPAIVLGNVSKRNALGPFDRFGLGFHLDQPIAADQVLSPGEWPVSHGGRPIIEGHAHALRGGLKPLTVEKDTRLDQLFVVPAH